MNISIYNLYNQFFRIRHLLSMEDEITFWKEWGSWFEKMAIIKGGKNEFVKETIL